MSKITRTIKASSENFQKLVRLGSLEDSFNSLMERLLRIYCDPKRKKKTTTATGNRIAGTGEPNNTDMNIVAKAKRFMDDSKTVSDDVIISYFPRCHTDRCLKFSRRHYVSEV
jgi:predicted CopG family antitoxin